MTGVFQKKQSSLKTVWPLKGGVMGADSDDYVRRI